MHNFFSKTFWFLLGFVLILLMLVSYPKQRAGAFSSSSNVTFYGADNKTPIYSVDVPYGYSLNDLQDANIINKSFFTDNTFSPWYFQAGAYSSFVDGKFYLKRTLNDSSQFFIYDLDTSLYRGQTLYFIASINGVINYYSWEIKSSGTGGSVGKATNIDGLNQRFYIYNDTRLGVTFDILARYQNNAYIDFIYVGTENLPYFNIDYVNHLYVNSGGTISDFSNWSQSEVNSVHYNFNSKYSPNANLYYSPKTIVYDIDRMFNTTIGQLGGYSYLSSATINEFKSTFMSLRNFNLDGVNIFNALLSIGRLLINIGLLVFYAVAIPFSAIIDLLAFISVLITPTSFYSFF